MGLLSALMPLVWLWTLYPVYNDTTQACMSNSAGDLGIYFSVRLID
jgi:hypothetical protein